MTDSEASSGWLCRPPCTLGGRYRVNVLRIMASKDTASGISSAASVGDSGSTAAGHPAGEEIQRWTADRKAAAVPDILTTKSPLHPSRRRPAARPDRR